MKRIYTLQDARKEKQRMDDRIAAYEKLQETDFTELLQAHPYIGVLVRNGRKTYYVNDTDGRVHEADDPRELIDDTDPDWCYSAGNPEYEAMLKQYD
jgi:hypothetical protein